MVAKPYRPWLILIPRLIVAGVFLVAGGLKARNPAQFLEDIQNYDLLPYVPTVMVALYLPWLEIIAAAALLFCWRLTAPITVLLGLTVTFCAALVSAWARGLELHCGCFGPALETTNFPMMLLRNAGIVLLLGWLLWSKRSSGLPSKPGMKIAIASTAPESSASTRSTYSTSTA